MSGPDNDDEIALLQRFQGALEKWIDDGMPRDGSGEHRVKVDGHDLVLRLDERGRPGAYVAVKGPLVEWTVTLQDGLGDEGVTWRWGQAIDHGYAAWTERLTNFEASAKATALVIHGSRGDQES